MLLPPIPWWLEVASPQAASGRPCLVLGIDVVSRIFAVGKRPALKGHPAVDVLAANEADRYRSTISVDVLLRTANRFLADLVGQRECGLLAAAIWLTIQVAELRALRRVDAVQTDPLAADFDSMTEALPAISATASWAEMTNSMARRKIRRRIVNVRLFPEMGTDLNVYRTAPVMIRHRCNRQPFFTPPKPPV